MHYAAPLMSNVDPTQRGSAALDDGLRRQLVNLGGREVAGWKVGLTSGSSRDAMGPGFRPFGYILRERVHRSGAALSRGAFARVGVENELCFRMARGLSGAAGRTDAIDAVGSVMPAFEINEQRLGRDASPADRLADDLNQWGIVLGEPQRLDWHGFDFSALRVALARDGAVVETVAAAGHIDDHFESIAALARQLHRFGRALDAGAVVITGAYTRQIVAAAGRWEGDFGVAIGKVGVEFT